MAQRTIYKCDICLQDLPVDDLHGFEFCGDQLVEKRCGSVHRHYCEPCIAAFIEATKHIADRPKEK